MTDNVAVLQGFTKEVWAESIEHEGPFLIKPDADLDGVVKAWDMDAQEFVHLNGWLWTFGEPDPVKVETVFMVREGAGA